MSSPDPPAGAQAQPQRFLPLALSLLALLATTGCSRATSTPSAPLATATSLPSPAATSSVPAAVLVVPALPSHQDVHLAVDGARMPVGPGIAYSRLMRFKSGPGVALPSLELECDLCREWQHPDPLTYRFTLRRGVLWPDLPPTESREVTAQDVAFSLQRLGTPGWPGAELLQAIASVETVDEETLEVRLRYPDADFLLALAHGASRIVAPEAVALGGDLREGPTIGTGPWALERYGPEWGASFRANPSYFEPGLPGMEGLEVRVAPEEEVRLAAVATGRADMAPLSPGAAEAAQGALGSLQRAVFPLPGTGVIFALNTTQPPFDRLVVRQALFRAVDPWHALEDARWWPAPVGVGVPAVVPDWRLGEEELRSYFGQADDAQALREVAVRDLVPFTLTVAHYGEEYLALGEAYRAMLQERGFQPELEVLLSDQYARRVWEERDFQAFLGPMPPATTPNAFLFGLLHSQGRWNVTRHEDAQLDTLIQEQSVAEVGRRERMWEVQRSILDQGLLFMPAEGGMAWVWGPRIQGFEPNFAAAESFHWARLRLGE